MWLNGTNRNTYVNTRHVVTRQLFLLYCIPCLKVRTLREKEREREREREREVGRGHVTGRKPQSELSERVNINVPKLVTEALQMPTESEAGARRKNSQRLGVLMALSLDCSRYAL